MNQPHTKVPPALAASPAAAGFRPAGAAIAIAAAFVGSPQVALAQPSGAQAIHGQASLSQQGANLLVTTQNGAGTSHSAINWQSFSVPGGSTTHFQQPNAASLSINRVVGNNPSAIFGTLSSNGRLVLVNPSGIAVGAGAVVDTAGFTASTLRMSDADALAGRLVFGGDGLASGALTVDGKIVARSGDVVLIAPKVEVGSGALVQSPSGATIVAAGQKVELTGRGLEGIRMELQAPSDQALNLGTLQGDAVGIFAGQLKHSGLINATAATAEGGKVVLKGLESADISGRVTASKGDQGGQVHATSGKVMLRSGAVIDVSGARGGGEALIGGGWQGKDGRIANAVETLVEAGANIKADATASGNGGTIVAWSDGATRVYGALSARGGEVSGNGGNIETSGRYLDMQGQVDTRAPNGDMGNLLLDPTNMFIAATQASAEAAGMMVGSPQISTGPNFTPTGAVQDSFVTTSSITSFLGGANVTIQTTNSSGTGAGVIQVVDPVSWTSGSELALKADNGIVINASIGGGAGSTLALSGGGGGSINQAAAGAGISVTNLYAHTSSGPVSLAGAGNTVSNFAAFSANGAISLVSSGNLTVVQGNPSAAFGGGYLAGVQNTGQNIDLTVSGGSLTIADTANGVRTPGGVASLSASGTITQNAGAPITANSLAVRALGNVTLETATNSVNNLAVSLGDVSNTNRVFKFRNGGALNVGAGIDGISGIQIWASGGGYDPLTPDAYISLVSGGALTQSAGALIGAKAIYAEGTRVALTEGNITGVIAGKATGAATGDIFAYRSINGINVNNVGAGSGIQNASGPDAIAIELTGTDVSQRAGSLITAAGGLRLVTTGPVNLADTSNNVSALAAVGASSLVYRDADALTVGIGGDGVSTTGGVVDIRTANALTIQASVSGNGVVLKAIGADLSINSVVDTGSSSGELRAGNNILLSGGTITGGGDLTVGSNLLWSGGSMTGSGKTIIAPGATANITGAVSLMRPLRNDIGGTIILSGSGQISAMSPGFLDNMGAFDIQNDGGFTGSAFTINNSGKFGKTAGTGVSMLNGVNFTNTGTLGVASGTMLFGSGGFSSNSGIVAIASGATLDTSNSTLANTSAGVIGGFGTLRLGTGILNNSGALVPGGPGAVGTLTIDAATVNLDAGTHIYADVLDTVNYDRVYVTGDVNLASGVTVVPDTSAATGLLPGDSFDILQSSLGSVGGTLPAAPGFDITFETSPAPAVRVALPAPVPPPATAPITSPTGTMADQIAELLPEVDLALATQVVAELSTNPLTTFTELVEKEEEQQASESGVDNLVDNNQCRR